MDVAFWALLALKAIVVFALSFAVMIGANFIMIDDDGRRDPVPEDNDFGFMLFISVMATLIFVALDVYY